MLLFENHGCSFNITCMTKKQKSQQKFILKSMAVLTIDRDAFAKRIGTISKTLESWLLPSTSKDFQHMPDMAWKYIQEIVDNHLKKQETLS